jgi:ATP-dependent Clp protease protease subunit
MQKNKLLQLLRDNARNDGTKSVALRAEKSDESTAIYVDDVIDPYFGVGAKALNEAFAKANGGDVLLNINSPGGDVFEARAMQAIVANYKGKVTGVIAGVCASAATYLALACDEVKMMDGSLFMIHNSWTIAMGDKNDLAETGALLDKIDGTIASDYVARTGKKPEEITALMDATTWFTAQEALDAKFIDAIEPNTKASSASQARWNLAAYPNAPTQPPEAPGPDLTALASAQTQRNRNRLRMLELNLALPA